MYRTMTKTVGCSVMAILMDNIPSQASRPARGGQLRISQYSPVSIGCLVTDDVDDEKG